MNDNNDNDNNTNGSDELQKIKQGSCMIPEKEIPSSFQNNSIQNNTFSKSRPSSAPHQRTSRSFNSTTNDFGTFEVTKSLLGKSHAMEQLSKQKVKGREAAKTNYVTLDWTEDQFRLVKGIKERRQDVEDLMEQRRKVLEISQERQKRAMERYRKIREGVKQQRDNYNWTKNASYEVMSLDKIGDVIKEETKQQHCNTQRAVEHIRYTMAPNGYANRRGKSVKGYVIGSGPLPANATTCLQDPRIVQTMKRFQWDEFGRRHFRTQDDIAETNDVKQAMEVIRKASANVSLYKLNIKQVFEDMDVSKDGFLSISEMENAFKCMGVALTETSLQALFKHFDPNNSGTVHYGEFVWAFFNKHSLIRQWTRSTSDLTYAQIQSKFRKADINGDGKLGDKEFKKLLTELKIRISDVDFKLMMERFDKDGDGDLDLNEFVEFIKSEIDTGGSLKVPKDPTASVGNKKRNNALQTTTNTNRKSQNAKKLVVESKQHARKSLGRKDAEGAGDESDGDFGGSVDSGDQSLPPDYSDVILRALPGTTNVNYDDVSRSYHETNFFPSDLKEGEKDVEAINGRNSSSRDIMLHDVFDEEKLVALLREQASIEKKLGKNYSKYYNTSK